MVEMNERTARCVELMVVARIDVLDMVADECGSKDGWMDGSAMDGWTDE